MTKFEELMDIIARKKNENKNDNSELEADALEVAGGEGTKHPLLSCGDDETDPGLLDQLHRSAKTKPNEGSGSALWDSDY
jgi:hypothetical protein